LDTAFEPPWARGVGTSGRFWTAIVKPTGVTVSDATRSRPARVRNVMAPLSSARAQPVANFTPLCRNTNPPLNQDRPADQKPRLRRHWSQRGVQDTQPPHIRTSHAHRRIAISEPRFLSCVRTKSDRL